ncbi:MAG: PIN domain-containing protein [Phycisphaerae bacterium]|nr:PIN domain-containing protein [Phycisphaerae bacterium]
MRVLLDTNILLDVLGRREPYYEDAARIWTLAETGKIEAFASAISFTNIFYIVRKFRDLRAARQAVKWMRDVFHVAPCDDTILHQAIDANWRDLEDAVQYFSAWRIEASYIISRNTGDFTKSDTDVLRPEEFLAMLSMTE